MSLAAKKQRGQMYSSNINASDPLFLWAGEFVNKICTISNHAYFLIAELIPSTNGPLLEEKILPLSSICVGDQATQG